MMNEAPFTPSAILGASEASAGSPWVVLKFGGSSVSSVERWSTIADLVENRRREGLRPVVVHSAVGDVSDELAAILDAALDGDPEAGITRVREIHFALADSLGLDGASLLRPALDELSQLVAGIRLVREVSLRVRVHVMALGELMATRLGAAYLARRGLPAVWADARSLLASRPTVGTPAPRDYLAATCTAEDDPDAFRAKLAGLGEVVVTQGFIAANRKGETVLLGRGGSDTSAAYFAAALRARRLEIWTDVPGMFSADPRIVPSARLLESLRYDEAQELASAGSSVLHPRCLAPLVPDRIPLFVRCTAQPEVAGTVVSSVTAETEPQVKGICVRTGITLISMESMGMWHEVGFLARAFAVFRDHGISVDFVSTSEANVTVSIDATDTGPMDLGPPLEDLATFCRTRVISGCAAVSLVGRQIRRILPRLSAALGVFEEEKVHLMSQAANDLNLSFVIAAEQARRLAGKLHRTLIPASGAGRGFGPGWNALERADAPPAPVAVSWWMEKRDRLLALAHEHDNVYVYDRETVRDAARRLLALPGLERVLYAVKANDHPDLLRVLAEGGVGFECVSLGEIEWLFRSVPGLDGSRVLFTPNFAPRTEYEAAFERGIRVTLDNLYPLQAWPELLEGRDVFVRIDPGKGRGHHEHVKTAGVHSKFGVPEFEVDELIELAGRTAARVVGLHAHPGSGVTDPEAWRETANVLVRIAERFPDVRTLDLGGGLGVPEKSGDDPFDLGALGSVLTDVRSAHPRYALWLEPGRYLVARAGVLLTRVTQVKGKGEMRYVGVGTGMNSLIRPALYGAYHEIVNLSRVGEPPRQTVTVVGPICETSDRLGTERWLPACAEGDVLLVADTGAYGRVMGSNYNRRGIASEVVI